MFEVGDSVETLIECSCPRSTCGWRSINVVYRGTVLRCFSGDMILIQFTDPCLPSKDGTCNRCGISKTLFANPITGQIICGRPECAYEHGFVVWEKLFPSERLINISAEQRRADKRKFSDALVAALADGLKEDFIDLHEVEMILRVARCLPS